MDTETEDRYMILYEAAIEAVEHVAQANWSLREKAAKRYLFLVAEGNGHTKSLDEIQGEINVE